MRGRRAGFLAAILVLAGLLGAGPAPRTLVIGSKAFPESWILGESMATLARSSGPSVEHRANLGGTEIVYAALLSGAVDAYPEYTGTIAEVILKSPGRPSLAELRTGLAPQGIGVSEPLGFNDGYALAVTARTRDRLNLRTISDLARHPELELGVTHEFLGRRDGWPGLAPAYGLGAHAVRGIQHELAYEALASGRVDVIDIYTTDAQIERMKLAVLEDDLGFFPRYDAVILYRLDLEREAASALSSIRQLEGRIDEKRMIRANACVVLEGQPTSSAAAGLLADIGLVGEPPTGEDTPGLGERTTVEVITANTVQHLKLVAISLTGAVLAGVPLGILATRAPWLATLTLAGAGMLQTIPSLALLAFLIPWLGVGAGPALVALFLYSLLPIVRNTFVGLTSISPGLEESARALALRWRTDLWGVRLPLASPAIMAGIKISAVINVGTATLAALIGAGGLGDPILAGIQLRRPDLILQGAVPAAALALVIQWGFDALDRLVIPRGLRLPPEPGA